MCITDVHLYYFFHTVMSKFQQFFYWITTVVKVSTVTVYVFNFNKNKGRTVVYVDNVSGVDCKPSSTKVINWFTFSN